jgi:hypothetical protein
MEAQLPTSTLRYRALSLKRNGIEKDIGLGNNETLGIAAVRKTSFPTACDLIAVRATRHRSPLFP